MGERGFVGEGCVGGGLGVFFGGWFWIGVFCLIWLGNES